MAPPGDGAPGDPADGDAVAASPQQQVGDEAEEEDPAATPTKKGGRRKAAGRVTGRRKGRGGRAATGEGTETPASEHEGDEEKGAVKEEEEEEDEAAPADEGAPTGEGQDATGGAEGEEADEEAEEDAQRPRRGGRKSRPTPAAAAAAAAKKSTSLPLVQSSSHLDGTVLLTDPRCISTQLAASASRASRPGRRLHRARWPRRAVDGSGSRRPRSPSKKAVRHAHTVVLSYVCVGRLTLPFPSAERDAKLTIQRRKAGFTRIIEQLQAERYSHFFESRVTKTIAPLYNVAVRRPTCLRDIVKAIKSGAISTSTELMRDVALLCANAMQFNGDEGEDSVGHCAKLMWDRFERCVLPLFLCLPEILGR